MVAILPSRRERRTIPVGARPGQGSELPWGETLPCPAVLPPRGKESKRSGTGCFWGRAVRSPSEEQVVLSCYHLEASCPLSHGAGGGSQVPQGIIPDPIPPPPLLQRQQLRTTFGLSVLLRRSSCLRKFDAGATGTADRTADEPERHHLRKARFWALVDFSSISGREKANSAESRAATPNHPYLCKDSSIPWRKNASFH